MSTRHFLVPASSGLAIIFLAALASAIRVTLSRETPSIPTLVIWGGVNVIAWGWSAVSLRRASRMNSGRLLLGLGDLLLPVNLYLVAITLLSPASVPLSASLAVLVALVYTLFADLAARRLPLAGHAHRAYLFTACSAIAIYLTHSTAGLPWTTVALLLVGLAGVVTVLGYLLGRPFRAHYGLASILLIIALVGVFGGTFVREPEGIMAFGAFLAALFLFAATWVNRNTSMGKLLAFTAWVVLTLAVGSTMHVLAAVGMKAYLLPAAAWVLLLMSFWGLVKARSLRTLRESAHWFALGLSGIILGLLWPLGRDVVSLYLAGLREYSFAGPQSLVIALPPGSRLSILALALVAVALGGSALWRQRDRVAAGHQRRSAALIDGFLSTVPPVLVLIVISAMGIIVFGTRSWLVTFLVLTGAGYCWAAAHQEEGTRLSPAIYPSLPLRVMGYAALGLAVITASYNLLAALVTLVAVILFLLFIAGWYDSASAYVLGLIHLLGLLLLVSFQLFPHNPVVALAWLYLLPVAWLTWRSARAAREDAWISRNTLGALSMIIIMAAFIIAASFALRRFHPLGFLITASLFLPIRYAWKSTWPPPVARLRRSVCLIGTSLGHIAIGSLVFSLLQWFNIEPALYGVAFGALGAVYLLGALALPGEEQPLSFPTLMPFVYAFSILALALTVAFSPVGVGAIVAWLLVIVVHVTLTARENLGRYYPAGPVKVLAAAAATLAAVNLLWHRVPALAMRFPLPEVFARDLPLELVVSGLLGLGLLASILMNRKKSLLWGLVAHGFILGALVLSALAVGPESRGLFCGIGYAYLLLVARVKLRRTTERGFSYWLPWVDLWLSSGLLLLLLAMNTFLNQWDVGPVSLIVVSFLILSPDWGRRLPAYVQHRFRRVFWTAYSLGHAATAVAVFLLLRSNGLVPSYYGLAFAALAGISLLGYWLAQGRTELKLWSKVLWLFSHVHALTSLVFILVFASRSTMGAFGAFLLALICLDMAWLSGRAVYKHLGAFLLITVMAFLGRAWNIGLWEFYLIPLGGYFGWCLYQGTRARRRAAVEPPAKQFPGGSLGDRFVRTGLTALILLILVAYPGWQFASTGGLIHLTVSGVGAVAATHLFTLTRCHRSLNYIIGSVLVLEAGHLVIGGRVDSPDAASLIFIAVGLLLMADLLFLARRQEARDAAR